MLPMVIRALVELAIMQHLLNLLHEKQLLWNLKLCRQGLRGPLQHLEAKKRKKVELTCYILLIKAQTPTTTNQLSAQYSSSLRKKIT